MSFDALASSLTLTGSLLSCIGSGCILICFIVYRNAQRSFRHALVFNLAISDFINSLTNCISGSIYIANHELKAGVACTFNGWIEQLSVQATDFSILAISVATLVVVTRQTRLDSISKARRVLMCLALWIMPLISSTTVTALGEMKPVSGNWCWISKDRPDLRYGLAHGWRFSIILCTVCIYAYTYQYLGRHFRSLVVPSIFTRQAPLPEERRQDDPGWNLSEQHHHRPASNRHDDDDDTQLTGSAAASPAGAKGHGRQRDPEPGGSGRPGARRRRTDAVEAEIKRMLLLNGYPVMYVLLWVPGLANRALEASGRPSSSRVLAALQCSTQFVGFANALTYGLNREMRQLLARDLRPGGGPAGRLLLSRD